jgi:hypothetical protein
LGLRWLVRLVGVVGVLVCGCGWFAGSVWATTGHVIVGEFGSRGTGDGQFNEAQGNGPPGVAVLASTGDVFASDEQGRVQRFSASGVFGSAFGIGAPYNTVGGVAVDPSGSVYVSTNQDPAVAAVVKYSVGGSGGYEPVYEVDAASSGTTLNNPIFGVTPLAVDPVDGTVYVAASGPSGPVIDRFDGATGAFLDLIDGTNGSPDGGFGCVSGLSVDGSHRVYVLDGCKGRVDRYDGVTGAFGITVDDGNSSGRGAVSAVAADPVSDEVYVAEAGPVGVQITHFTAGGAAPVYTFDASNVGGVRAMAVGGAGTVYTSDGTRPVVERFARFDGPTVTTDAATDVATRGVTVNGSINPEGADSSYHFEYGTGLTYGSRTPEVNVDSGSSPVVVSAPIGGLKPHQAYHFRLVGSRSGSPGSIAGADQSVTTALEAATVGGSPGAPSPAFPSAITPRSVTLHGMVNANNTGGAPPVPFFQSTVYLFEYGTTTAYGSTAVGADGGTLCSLLTFVCDGRDRPVAASVSGLVPGTTYHFRVVADNGTGGPQQGADQTFVTAPAAAAGAVAVTAKSAMLRGTIDPHGVSTSYHFNYGLTAAYGSSTPEVDGGAGDGERLVAQPIEGLRPSTTYHVQVVTQSGGVVRSGGDGVFVTAPAPVAVATFPTGVSTNAATLTGTASTFNAAGSYRFELAALDGSYALSTPEVALEPAADARPVSAAVTGLPVGKTFRVQLVVTGNAATTFSDLITFATAPNPQVAPVTPEIDPTTVFGCSAPHIDAYNKRPDPGDVITITGQDLGTSGTVALGDGSLTPTDWAPTAFKVQVPDDAKGTLALTADCGRVSNTIAIAVFAEPDNTFTVPSRSVTGTTAALVIRVPGPGKLETSGARVTATKTTVKKAVQVTIKVKLNTAGNRALTKARRLTVKFGVRYTPAGGKPATKTLTVTFQHKAGR